jgi:hypothetical protein
MFSNQTMDVRTFTKLFPSLYHLTFAANLPGIRAHGLHSAISLADLHAFDATERETTLTLRRRCIQTLHGVSLRDQHAANEKKMKSCLTGITIPDWLTLLNSKMFFFVEKEKALRLAETYATYANVLLEIDTTALLATHAGNITLSRINTGSFLHNPRPRGRASFIPLDEYIYHKRRDTPAELTLDVPIPNVLSIATLTELNPAAA